MKKNNIGFVVAVLLAIHLSSCFVAKQYQQPDIAGTENLFRTDQLIDTEPISSANASIANVSWEDLFSDTLLKTYIRHALDNNIDIRIALKNIDIASAYLHQSQAAFLPSIFANLSYGYTHYSESSQIAVRDAEQFNLGTTLSWEADIWGKIKSQEKAATAAYLQTIEAHKAVKTRLVANVATLYFQLGAISDQIEIARQTIASRDSSLAVTQALMEAGQLTAVAVKQTEAQIYDASLILVSLHEQERILENTLCLLLNEPAHAIARTSLQNVQVTTPLQIGVPAELLANRPDVRQTEMNLMQAFELTNVARSNFYPSLTITAGTGLQSADIKNWLSVHAVFANLAGGLLQPVYNRRQIKTQFEVAQHRQEQALLQYQQILLVAGNEVSNALFDYQTQTEAIVWQEKKYIAYQSAAAQADQLLLNGLANYLEVLTARQNALTAQLNLANARFLQWQSIVTLYESLGGGWR